MTGKKGDISAKLGRRVFDVKVKRGDLGVLKRRKTYGAKENLVRRMVGSEANMRETLVQRYGKGL